MSLDTPRACLNAETLLHALQSASPVALNSDGMAKKQRSDTRVLVTINTDILTELVFGISQPAAEFYSSRSGEHKGKI